MIDIFSKIVYIFFFMFCCGFLVEELFFIIKRMLGFVWGGGVNKVDRMFDVKMKGKGLMKEFEVMYEKDNVVM